MVADPGGVEPDTDSRKKTILYLPSRKKSRPDPTIEKDPDPAGPGSATLIVM